MKSISLKKSPSDFGNHAFLCYDHVAPPYLPHTSLCFVQWDFWHLTPQ